MLCSSTNGQRIRSIQATCQHSKRTLALDPFGKEILECIDFPLSEWVGFVPYYIKDKRTRKYLRPGFISSDVIARRSRLTFMVRATMGGFLKRLDRKFSLNSSVLLYSLWRGYENTSPIREFLELCHSLGIEVCPLHASGHADREELAALIKQVRPYQIIPIHTQDPEAFRGLHERPMFLMDGERFEM